MNLEEIRSRNSTVHALEALHLCRLLHVSSFSEKYGHGIFVVPHVLSSSSSILYLHLYHSLYPKYMIYKFNDYTVPFHYYDNFKSTVHSFEEFCVAVYDWSKSILWCFGISSSFERIINTNLNFWNMQDCCFVAVDSFTLLCKGIIVYLSFSPLYVFWKLRECKVYSSSNCR